MDKSIKKKGGSILSPSLQDITRKKEEYGEDIERIIALLSFNPENIFIVGSFGIRSMKYASDIDMIEPISFSSSISPIISKFKKNITEINNAKNVYLGDVKIGEVPEWEIIDETAYIENGKIYGYDATDAREKVNKLKSNGVVTDEEYSQYMKLIKDKPTLEELQTIKKEIRPHILRWKATEIKKGEKSYRGRTFKLKDAFTMGLVKVDIITFLNNGRITEASIIYDVRKKGIRINKYTINPIRSFKNDIQYYKSVGDYFKVLKRLFSLYSYQKDDKNIKKLYEILNSDLGIVNQIINDIDILGSLLMNYNSIPKDKITITINEFINRLNSVYTLNDFIKKEKNIIDDIRKAINSKTREEVMKHLEPVKDKLKQILNKHSLKFINKFNI
jgi:hypothetical protein